MNPDDLALGKSVSLDSQENRMPPTSHLLFRIPLNLPIWVYFSLSFVLFEATYVLSLALRYTSFFSASMLDNTNIFAAMAASRLFLKKRYSRKHFLGAFICLIGVVLNLLSDFETNKNDTAEVNLSHLEAFRY